LRARKLGCVAEGGARSGRQLGGWPRRSAAAQLDEAFAAEFAWLKMEGDRCVTRDLAKLLAPGDPIPAGPLVPTGGLIAAGPLVPAEPPVPAARLVPPLELVPALLT
jgi:hypothetical protein